MNTERQATLKEIRGSHSISPRGIPDAYLWQLTLKESSPGTTNMTPILLIHGYSAESPQTEHDSIKNIYRSLADDLKASYPVVDIDLSRYVSLNDSISIFDIAHALDRVLNREYPELLRSGFNPIIHSTGALVVRKWIKLFSPKAIPDT